MANTGKFCAANFSEKLLIQLFIPNTSGKTMEINSHSFLESTHQDLKGKSPLYIFIPVSYTHLTMPTTPYV